MAVNLSVPALLYPVAGVRLGSAAAGLRKPGRQDIVVIECAADTKVAAVFTRNRFCAAPVHVARTHLAAAAPRALLINTGYANCGTGEPGMEDARASCAALAKLLGCRPEQVLPFSTGIIGQRFPIDLFVAGLPHAVAALEEGKWLDAAVGIMTTDTMPKAASRRVTLSGREVTLTGISKGAGMIQPNMATMLAFLATDADIDQGVLARCLSEATELSFNRVTVDGDTSTNDACVLLATGRAGNARIAQSTGAEYDAFRSALIDLCTELAQAIVRDGEGATKFITIEVMDGDSESNCVEVARTVANSPLIKTAFFASDPNWGRLLAAIGRARVPTLDVSRVAIWLNDTRVVHQGALAPEYTEAQGQAAMKPSEIHVKISLGVGKAAARVWTCDFSYDYVRINADYRS